MSTNTNIQPIHDSNVDLFAIATAPANPPPAPQPRAESSFIAPQAPPTTFETQRRYVSREPRSRHAPKARSSKFILPRFTFARLMRALLGDQQAAFTRDVNFRWQRSALAGMQVLAEEFADALFANALKVARHSGRKTVKGSDILLLFSVQNNLLRIGERQTAETDPRLNRPAARRADK